MQDQHSPVVAVDRCTGEEHVLAARLRETYGAWYALAYTHNHRALLFNTHAQRE